MDKRRILPAIGSLGGGNHFIAVNKNSENEYFLTVHSGSRNYGKCIAEYHQKKAVANVGGKGIGYLTGQAKEDYLADMQLAQVYAALNRRVILKRIASFLKVKYLEDNIIESVHNYIDFSDNIIRKGAISANKDQKILIPLSMADGILFCKGKGNADWNNSAPHGAGRLMSRTAAKQSITVSAFKKRMEEAGVWTSCISKETLDEAPQAYKDPAMIIDAIKDTAELVDCWKEVYNFKAG
jgi:RNA-splicing ligase RtcB